MSELGDLKKMLSLTEQDRDSWKYNFITTRDAANEHIDQLTEELRLRGKRIDELHNQVSDYEEALADVIRNSHDIIAKKVCSRALEKYRKDTP